jgi:hypothetical protein
MLCHHNITKYMWYPHQIRINLYPTSHQEQFIVMQGLYITNDMHAWMYIYQIYNDLINKSFSWIVGQLNPYSSSSSTTQFFIISHFGHTLSHMSYIRKKSIHWSNLITYDKLLSKINKVLKSIYIIALSMHNPWKLT